MNMKLTGKLKGIWCTKYVQKERKKSNLFFINICTKLPNDTI